MFVSDLLCSLDRLSIYVWCACPSTQNHGNSGPPNENAVTLGQQAGGPSRRPHTRPRGGSRAFDGGCLAFVVGRDLTKRGGSWKQMSPNAERLSYQCTTTLASAEHLVGILVLHTFLSPQRKRKQTIHEDRVRLSHSCGKFAAVRRCRSRW